ncbi:MAG: hypothetical protein JSU68_06420, partial [Phycisphaerales bacterium]
MRADERAYRRRGRLWLLVVVGVAVLFWAIAPDIEHERITPVCEICGREATTALPDADGKFHAYCQEHAPEERTRTEVSAVEADPESANHADVGYLDPRS